MKLVKRWSRVPSSVKIETVEGEMYGCLRFLSNLTAEEKTDKKEMAKETRFVADEEFTFALCACTSHLIGELLLAL